MLAALALAYYEWCGKQQLGVMLEGDTLRLHASCFGHRDCVAHLCLYPQGMVARRLLATWMCLRQWDGSQPCGRWCLMYLRVVS